MEEDREGFHIYLPSNTRFLDSNTTSSYVVKLAREIALTGEWECGLSEIHYRRSWEDIARGEGVFFIYVHGVPRRCVLPNGQYDDNDHLVRTLGGAMKLAVYDLTPSEKLSTWARYDPIATRVILHTPKGITMRLTKRLAHILGFARNNRYVKLPEGKNVGEYPLDYINDIEALYVYSDIVQPSFVGDVLVPLLRVVPIQGSMDKKLCYVEYIKPTYVPLSKFVFSTVKVHITDSTGRPVPFLYGKTTIVLHIRRAKNTRSIQVNNTPPPNS